MYIYICVYIYNLLRKFRILHPTHRYARIPVTNQWQKHRFGRMAFAHSSSLINVPWDIVQAGEYRILLTLAEQSNFRSAKDIHGWLVSNYACSHLQGESNGGSNTYINNHPKVAGQSLSWDHCPTFLAASTFRICMNVCGVYICEKMPPNTGNVGAFIWCTTTITLRLYTMKSDWLYALLWLNILTYGWHFFISRSKIAKVIPRKCKLKSSTKSGLFFRPQGVDTVFSWTRPWWY